MDNEVTIGVEFTPNYSQEIKEAYGKEWQEGQPFKVFPGEGSYYHPRYGVEQVTKERLDKFVNTFNTNPMDTVRPIRIEHMKEEGAIGAVTQLEARDDGLWATPAWTKRGVEILDDEAFWFSSAEVFAEWPHPKTKEVFEDVIVGAAVTNMPYFMGDLTQEMISLSSEFTNDLKEYGLESPKTFSVATVEAQTLGVAAMDENDIQKLRTDLDKLRDAVGEKDEHNRKLQKNFSLLEESNKELKGDYDKALERVDLLEGAQAYSDMVSKVKSWSIDTSDAAKMMVAAKVGLDEKAFSAIFDHVENLEKKLAAAIEQNSEGNEPSGNGREFSGDGDELSDRIKQFAEAEKIKDDQDAASLYFAQNPAEFNEYMGDVMKSGGLVGGE